jgi:hypothetical protein
MNGTIEFGNPSECLMSQVVCRQVVPDGLGTEAQVDWYEAWVDLGDERTTIQVFTMRSMASGAAFHRAYLRQLCLVATA